jgi:hypothetical protein
MLETERADAIFADAQFLYADALEELDRGNLRNSAEKAWGATKRATDALLLARTGQEPRTSGQTIRGIRALRRQDPTLENLRLRFVARLSTLHGLCFYDGICEPEEDLIADIRETADYISNAQDLAGESA